MHPVKLLTISSAGQASAQLVQIKAQEWHSLMQRSSASVYFPWTGG
jgi:hypothetical protein